MTYPRQQARRVAGRWMGCFLLLASFGACTSARAATAGDLYFERTIVRVADQRCRLFDSNMGSALAAAQAQARGAALRAGFEEPQLQQFEQRARQRAYKVPCNSPDMAVASSRVKEAFTGYARLIRMTYHGEMADWRADRTMTREPSWRLTQQTSFGYDRVNFGLVGVQGDGALVAVASFADGANPYAVRLVMRDTRRAARPYLDKRLADSRGRVPLGARLPPVSSTQSFVAEFRTTADPRLVPGRSGSGYAFRFPDAAREAMTRLDPRESVVLEFVFADRRGESVRKAYMEVGDFAAGRAFLQVAYR
jgi:hypothetical protein